MCVCAIDDIVPRVCCCRNWRIGPQRIYRKFVNVNRPAPWVCVGGGTMGVPRARLPAARRPQAADGRGATGPNAQGAGSWDRHAGAGTSHPPPTHVRQAAGLRPDLGGHGAPRANCKLHMLSFTLFRPIQLGLLSLPHVKKELAGGSTTACLTCRTLRPS